MLGIPLLRDIAPRFMAAVKAAHPDGVTCREMHRKNREIRLEAWMNAAHALLEHGKVRSEYFAVPQPAPMVQELRYFLPFEPKA
jgi:hypothetical protein